MNRQPQLVVQAQAVLVVSVLILLVQAEPLFYLTYFHVIIKVYFKIECFVFEMSVCGILS